MAPTMTSFSFGSITDLFVEYARRSEPFSMTNEHFHDYYEIYYMLSGKRVYFIHDRSYPVEQGDLVFINKRELHKTMQNGDKAHERVVIHFNDDHLSEMRGKHSQFLLSPFQQNSHVIRLPRQEQLAIEQIMRHMLREIEGKQPGYELIPFHNIIQLLLTVARYIQSHELTPLHYESPMHAKMFEIVRYINNNFAESLRLEALSKQFFISSYYLSRMFKDVTGFTFSDYVVLTRMKEAQRLLRDTTMSISDISASVGFDNFSHFGKTFKRITHQSPREYRKSMS